MTFSSAINQQHSRLQVQQLPRHKISYALSTVISTIVALASLLFAPWQAAIALGLGTFALTRIIQWCVGKYQGERAPRDLPAQINGNLGFFGGLSNWFTPTTRTYQPIVHIQETDPVIVLHRPPAIHVPRNPPPIIVRQAPSFRDPIHPPGNNWVSQGGSRVVPGGGHEIPVPHRNMGSVPRPLPPGLVQPGDRPVVRGGHFQ